MMLLNAWAEGFKAGNATGLQDAACRAMDAVAALPHDANCYERTGGACICLVSEAIQAIEREFQQEVDSCRR